MMPAPVLITRPDATAIERAVVSTVGYSDVFEYPLRAVEVHRYLHGVRATPEATAEALRRSARPGGPLVERDGFYTLRGREELVDLRRTRAAHATRLWSAAVRYGHVIAGLPFVRMVAITGSLVWDNVDRTGDIDYMIVTEPGRLWICRWLVSVVVRVARLTGVRLCHNYVVSTRALAVKERNLYSAYELACMTPIAGLGMYRRVRRANLWSAAYLPNAADAPTSPHLTARPPLTARSRILARLARLGEQVLRAPVVTALERYEMRYRIRKRARQDGIHEQSYGPDWYSSASGNRQRALAGFSERLQRLNADL